MFLNYAVWESVEHFRAAFTNPEFRGALAAYPSSVVASPHLFEKVAVPICVRISGVRHSGAERSEEPGIHSHWSCRMCAAFTPAALWLWIPGPRLRRVPE